MFVAQRQLSVTQGFFAGRYLPRMLLAVSATAVLKLLIKASISVSRLSRTRRDRQTFLLSLLEKFYDVRVLKFLKTEPEPYFALVFYPLEAESEGHHYKLMVTSDIGSWKAPGLCDIHT